MLRRIAATNRPAMLVLPFVALCAEKSASLARLLAPLGKEVREFYGGNHSHAAVGMVRRREGDGLAYGRLFMCCCPPQSSGLSSRQRLSLTIAPWVLVAAAAEHGRDCVHD